MRHNVGDEIFRIIIKEKKYNVELYEEIGYESDECDDLEEVEEIKNIEKVKEF